MTLAGHDTQSHCAEHGLHLLAGAVLEEDAHLAAQDEEDLFDLVGVGGVALARRHEHDAEREVLGGNVVAIGLAGGAVADEAVLRSTIALDARIGERIPVSCSVQSNVRPAARVVLTTVLPWATPPACRRRAKRTDSIRGSTLDPVPKE